MAIYYFHLSNGHTTVDHDGADHPDLDSIRKEAVRSLRELLNIGPTDGLWTGEAWKVWVTDRPDATARAVLSLELNAR
jgi:hypothetical protein